MNARAFLFLAALVSVFNAPGIGVCSGLLVPCGSTLTAMAIARSQPR